MFKGLLNRVKVDIVCVYLTVIFGGQLTVSTGQWGRTAEFLRIFDKKSQSRFS